MKQFQNPTDQLLNNTQETIGRKGKLVSSIDSRQSGEYSQSTLQGYNCYTNETDRILFNKTKHKQSTTAFAKPGVTFDLEMQPHRDSSQPYINNTLPDEGSAEDSDITQNTQKAGIKQQVQRIVDESITALDKDFAIIEQGRKNKKKVIQSRVKSIKIETIEVQKPSIQSNSSATEIEKDNQSSNRSQNHKTNIRGNIGYIKSHSRHVSKSSGQQNYDSGCDTKLKTDLRKKKKGKPPIVKKVIDSITSQTEMIDKNNSIAMNSADRLYGEITSGNLQKPPRNSKEQLNQTAELAPAKNNQMTIGHQKHEQVLTASNQASQETLTVDIYKANFADKNQVKQQRNLHTTVVSNVSLSMTSLINIQNQQNEKAIMTVTSEKPLDQQINMEIEINQEVEIQNNETISPPQTCKQTCIEQKSLKSSIVIVECEKVYEESPISKDKVIRNEGFSNDVKPVKKEYAPTNSTITVDIGLCPIRHTAEGKLEQQHFSSSEDEGELKVLSNECRISSSSQKNINEEELESNIVNTINYQADESNAAGNLESNKMSLKLAMSEKTLGVTDQPPQQDQKESPKAASVEVEKENEEKDVDDQRMVTSFDKELGEKGDENPYVERINTPKESKKSRTISRNSIQQQASSSLQQSAQTGGGEPPTVTVDAASTDSKDLNVEIKACLNFILLQIDEQIDLIEARPKDAGVPKMVEVNEAEDFAAQPLADGVPFRNEQPSALSKLLEDSGVQQIVEAGPLEEMSQRLEDETRNGVNVGNIYQPSGEEIVVHDTLPASSRGSRAPNSLGQMMEAQEECAPEMLEEELNRQYINSSRKHLLPPSANRYETALEQSVVPIVSIEANVAHNRDFSRVSKGHDDQVNQKSISPDRSLINDINMFAQVEGSQHSKTASLAQSIVESKRDEVQQAHMEPIEETHEESKEKAPAVQQLHYAQNANLASNLLQGRNKSQQNTTLDQIVEHRSPVPRIPAHAPGMNQSQQHANPASIAYNSGDSIRVANDNLARPPIVSSSIDQVLRSHPERQRAQQLMIKEKLAKIRSENYQPNLVRIGGEGKQPQMAAKNQYLRRVAGMHQDSSSRIFQHDGKPAKQHKPIRDSRDSFQPKQHQHLKVEANFSLEMFMQEHQGLMDCEPKPASLPREKALAIHNFHRQMRTKGKRKNRGPINWPGGKMPQSRINSQYFQSIRDPTVAASIAAANKMMRESGASNIGAELRQSGYDTNVRASYATHEHPYGPGENTGIIDINQAFMLVQTIKQAHGFQTATESQIQQSFGGNGSLDSGDNSLERIKAYKWTEVMSFMKENPHILIQLLNFQEEKQRQQQDQQFFTRRPRYTEKVLKGLAQGGIPGSIGQMRTNNSFTRAGGSLPVQRKSKLKSNFTTLGPGRHALCVPPTDRIEKESKATVTLPRKSRRKKQKRPTAVDVRPVLQHKSLSPTGPQGLNQRQEPAYMGNTEAEPSAAEPTIPRGFSGIIQPVNRSQQRAYSSNIFQAQRQHNRLEPLQHTAANPRITEGTLRNGQLLSEQEQMERCTPPGVRGGGDRETQQLPQANSMNQFNLYNRHIQNELINPQLKEVASHQQLDTNRQALIEQPVSVGYYQPRFDILRDASEGRSKTISSTDEPMFPQKGTPEAQKPRIMANVNIAQKPQTNEIQKRKAAHSYLNQHGGINIKSEYGVSPGPVKQVMTHDGTRSQDYEPSPVEPDRRKVALQIQSHMDVNRYLPPRSGKITVNPDLASQGSQGLSKYDELTQQKKMLDAEEAELNKHRNQIQSEKDRITRQLKRLETREMIVEREEMVRKQRMILEIEKKKLREEMAELDGLKQMLETKKNDTATGFHELAESNKEMRSFKSGELYRDRSMHGYSRASCRSKYLPKPGTGKPSSKAGGTTDGARSDPKQHPDNLHLKTLDERRGAAAAQVMQTSESCDAKMKTQENFGPNKITVIEVIDEKEKSEFANQGNVESPDPSPAKSKDFIPPKILAPNDQFIDDEQLIHSTEDLNVPARRSLNLDGAYEPLTQAEPGQEHTQGPLCVGSRLSTGGKPSPTRRLASPVGMSYQAQSQQTFLSVAGGFFDWHQSRLMQDVTNCKAEFSVPDLNQNAYTEPEVFALITEIKESQKALRGADKMKIVYTKAFDTLQELMAHMNQSILFQLIAEKYSEVNLDNTVKLLVRCKQLLVCRKLAYSTLQGIAAFETEAKALREAVDNYLENSQVEGSQQRITDMATGGFLERTNEVLSNIAKLRDQHKLFSKMGATTSKGHQVLNVMAYKRRDAIRYLLREYDSLRKLVQVVDVQMPIIKQ